MLQTYYAPRMVPNMFVFNKLLVTNRDICGYRSFCSHKVTLQWNVESYIPMQISKVTLY